VARSLVQLYHATVFAGYTGKSGKIVSLQRLQIFRSRKLVCSLYLTRVYSKLTATLDSRSNRGQVIRIA